MHRPTISIKGKPREKIFNCGAARVITPIEKFIIKPEVIAGSAISRALLNIQLPRLAIFHRPCSPIKPPVTGNTAVVIRRPAADTGRFRESITR